MSQPTDSQLSSLGVLLFVALVLIGWGLGGLFGVGVGLLCYAVLVAYGLSIEGRS
jgi:hypothetical protein